MKQRPKLHQRYPWERWFGKRVFKLTRGREYDCQPHSMGVQVRLAAGKRGLRVSVCIDEGTIRVKVLGKGVRRGAA